MQNLALPSKGLGDEKWLKTMPDHFKYTLDIKDIQAYKKLTVDQKLNWLEEITAFNRTLPKKIQKSHQYFLGKTNKTK